MPPREASGLPHHIAHLHLKGFGSVEGPIFRMDTLQRLADGLRNSCAIKTYMPVNAAAVRAADEARKKGRKLLSEEHNEFKKLKLGTGKVETGRE